MKTTTLTATGIARVLARGIKANFAPDNQRAEIDRLVEYLQDLAMSRGMHAEMA
jgi:selenocysteine lyase/cysteine desulfurase